MNRRFFLQALGLAPAIVPAAVQAAAVPQPIFGEAILGETLPLAPFVDSGSHAPPAYADYIRRCREGFMARDEVRMCEDLGPVDGDSVAAQMREHDLFEADDLEGMAG